MKGCISHASIYKFLHLSTTMIHLDPYLYFALESVGFTLQYPFKAIIFVARKVISLYYAIEDVFVV